jgi:succinyl-diaminopimelate desuccinylase
MMAIDPATVLELTRELVRIPSVHDPATGRNEEPAARWVAGLLRDLGWAPVIDQVAPGRPNVIAVVDGGRPGPTLCFEGHTDVVTEGDRAHWTVDPFAAEVRDGRLYGRGSADMKGGLVAAILATRALADQGPFSGRVVLAALVDEEGMMAGAKQFVANGFAAGVDAAICCEPEDGEICNTSKGALRLRIGFTGAMAHGAMPHQGRNPNPVAARFLAELDGVERRLQAEHGEHEHLGLPYLTPTVLRAGEPAQMNVIPAHADVWIDVRTIPGIDHGVLVDDITAVAAHAATPHDVVAVVEVIDDRPCVDTPPESPVVRALWDGHAAITGETPRLGGVPGATDGTILTARTGMPTVVYGPGGKWIAHQADEHVEVHALSLAAEVYVEAAARFFHRAR